MYIRYHYNNMRTNMGLKSQCSCTEYLIFCSENTQMKHRNLTLTSRCLQLDIGHGVSIWHKCCLYAFAFLHITCDPKFWGISRLWLFVSCILEYPKQIVKSKKDLCWRNCQVLQCTCKPYFKSLFQFITK